MQAPLNNFGRLELEHRHRIYPDDQGYKESLDNWSNARLDRRFEVNTILGKEVLLVNLRINSPRLTWYGDEGYRSTGSDPSLSPLLPIDGIGQVHLPFAAEGPVNLRSPLDALRIYLPLEDQIVSDFRKTGLINVNHLRFLHLMWLCKNGIKFANLEAMVSRNKLNDYPHRRIYLFGQVSLINRAVTTFDETGDISSLMPLLNIWRANMIRWVDKADSTDLDLI